MTELATGLGMLGFSTIDDALRAQPVEMVSVSPETWVLLRQAFDGGGLRTEFTAAWENGQAFARSADGLRHRRPVMIEWKGSHRAPGDEVAPIDLRVDHVFLISCKYLSRITINASPFHLFERLLQGAHGIRSADWFAQVAPRQYQSLYQAARDGVGLFSLPSHVSDLTAEEKRMLSGALREGWPDGAVAPYQELVEGVTVETARRWREQAKTPQQKESLYWRLIRVGSAPYFVLGTATDTALRLRIATPWDWRLRFKIRRFEITPQAGGQPRVAWNAVIEDRHSGELHEVPGHVEVRWSHGRFSGNPEAKVYLDAPHGDVPGYFPLR